MKYIVEVEAYGDVSVSKGRDGADLRLEFEDGSQHAFYLSFEEFKTLQRAMGYVRSEIEADK